MEVGIQTGSFARGLRSRAHVAPNTSWLHATSKLAQAAQFPSHPAICPFPSAIFHLQLRLGHTESTCGGTELACLRTARMTSGRSTRLRG